MVSVQDRPKTNREWQAILGIDNQCFTRLSDLFGTAYEQKRGQTLADILNFNPNGSNFKIRSYSDFVFFILFILKTGLTFDQAAFVFKIDLAGVKRYFDTGLNILYNALEKENYLPIREFVSPSDMNAYFSSNKFIIIDGTEQRIQKPQDKEKQRDTYSGKKKANTYKCLIISSEDTYMHYVSKVYMGKQHDFSILKEEFDPHDDWFEGFTVRLDLGYIGFDKQYPKSLPYLPHKNYKNRPITETQKQENQVLSKERIKVEHSIGGIKRYEFVSGQSRLKNEFIYDQVLAVCAGLWNFYITR